MIGARHHIRAFRFSTVVDQGKVSIQATSQEILVDEDSRPEKCGKDVTKRSVGKCEANEVLVVGEVACYLDEKLTWQVYRLVGRHQTRYLIEEMLRIGPEDDEVSP